MVNSAGMTRYGVGDRGRRNRVGAEKAPPSQQAEGSAPPVRVERCLGAAHVIRAVGRSSVVAAALLVGSAFGAGVPAAFRGLAIGGVAADDPVAFPAAALVAGRAGAVGGGACGATASTTAAAGAGIIGGDRGGADHHGQQRGESLSARAGFGELARDPVEACGFHEDPLR